jgi:uncharacterized protein (TIGR03435 family)
VIFKISTTDSDKLQAVMYSIDQTPAPLPGTVTGQTPNIKISIPAAGSTYDGKLSADGNAITGTFAYGAAQLPLNLTRATSETAWAIPPPPGHPKSMPADARPVFDVATIKLSKPNAQLSILVSPGGNQFSTTNTSLSDLIAFAWKIHARQITGGPSWLESEKYDLVAKPDIEGLPNDTQVRTMLQKLLADRFQLTFHRDTKELTVYTLVPGKTGPKLAQSTGDPNGLSGMGFRALGALIASNANMKDFTSLLQTMVLDRPVVDHSGVAGRYDFTLNWTPDESQFTSLAGLKPPAGNADAPPDLYTAIQQQLGLKLESAREPVEVLVIDRVERPSGN